MSKEFYCKDCHIQFKRKQNLEHHLTTEKHSKRSTSSTTKRFACLNCQKSFLYSSGLSKHRNRCTNAVAQLAATPISLEITELIAHHNQEKETLLQENERMKKQIDELLEKVKTAPPTNVINNTKNIENQTNFNINYYGCENLEYITDKFIQEMMKIPYSSIPHIIKHIHFHPAHPENHNLKITNRKLPYASVFNKTDKWELVQKRQTIEELMQKGYGMMDDRAEENLNQLSDRAKERFQDFQNKFETEDPEALKKIYLATELCLLNGNLGERNPP